MSGGNAVTEYTRQEYETEAAIVQASALISNAVLRRALAIAAHELTGRDSATPDAGVALMIAWVMQASDEMERACDLRAGGQCEQRREEREP
jgi:hypothetical protein